MPLLPATGKIGLGATIRGREIAAELEEIQRVAMAEAINEILEEIFEMSQQEVPKSEDQESLERFGQTLQESGHIVYATPETLVGEIEYDHPSAAAQHEGKMTYVRDDKTIEWVVENYTTGGTKSHYLSDPMKAMIPQIDARYEVWWNKLMAERYPTV